MTKVKICGITNLKDAEFAVSCGADAIGFIFAKSPRQVSVATAEKISRALGPWVTTVGVFVNETEKNILKIATKCRLSAVQLHGDESKDFLASVQPFKVIRAFRVSEKKDLRRAHSFEADATLFDTQVQGLYGGSGRTFDWKLLKESGIPEPFILSGGLNPNNVKIAVHMLKPYGVDVSSGVEVRPGKKDPNLVRKFIRNAKNAS